MTKTAAIITLDHLDGICLEGEQVNHHSNELGALRAWQLGLLFLYRHVRTMERAVGHDPARLTYSFSIGPIDPKESLNSTCCFQWYAVTLCNYVELVGRIGHESDHSRPASREYLGSTIPIVRAYRNLVGAHTARARPFESNAAERLACLIPPSTLINGRLFADCKIIKQVSGTVSDSGRIRPWSLTLTHEELAARYWPLRTNK